MTSSHIRLTIDSGDFESGFSVGLLCFDSHEKLKITVRGKLPAKPSLQDKYQTWKGSYMIWGGASRLEPLDDQPVNVSYFEQVETRAKRLEEAMNQWLDSDTFQPLRQTIYQELSFHKPTTVIIQTQQLYLLRLPWPCWRLLEAFPLTQIILAPESYRGTLVSAPNRPSSKVRVLAVMAGGYGVDLLGDRLALENLPSTDSTICNTPTRQGITDLLWTAPWDIFFFAGHSSSQAGQGQFKISPEKWHAPSDLKFSLQAAARKGLKLAIFNSCDGLAIAQDLVQNDIPFIITMREPVPDAVAHAFLQYFLTAYSSGQSLFQAFQDARKRLEALEDQCPQATWLPILMCNPAVHPPGWHDFCSRPRTSFVLQRSPGQRIKIAIHQSLASSRTLFFTSLLLFVLVIRSLGWMQGLELWSFDQLLQFRPQEIQDSRLLIVEIDEAALQRQSAQQGSISDQQLSQVIQVLSQSQPRVIGIDIYRDHPNLDASLQTIFQTQSNVIGVCKSPDFDQDETGVTAPQGLSPQNLGFSDILEDGDGVVRRQLLFMGVSPTQTCVTPWSLSSKLALRYLAEEKITHNFSTDPNPRDQHLKIGNRAFHPIRAFWGGYQRINLGGNQVMLNYRAVPELCKLAPVVGIQDVLNHQVSPEQIRDRLVMIGVTANTTADFWETPYLSQKNHRIPGVFLQAHMVSQIISAVKDQRPLLRTWPRWGDILWILSCGIAGRWTFHHLHRNWLIWAALSLSIIGVSFAALTISGLWIPLVPSLLTLWLVGLAQRPDSTQTQWVPNRGEDRTEFYKP